MADNAVFELTAAEIERRSGLDGLAARGTIRIALRDAGLDAKTVTPEQMAVVLDRVLPAMLDSRGCADPDGVCSEAAGALRVFQGATAPSHAPESFVARTRASR